MPEPRTFRRHGVTYWPDGIIEEVDPRTEGMRMPVRCNCGHVYDIAAVEMTARYADCDLWHCPRCKVVSDNRPWVHQPYRKLGR